MNPSDALRFTAITAGFSLSILSSAMAAGQSCDNPSAQRLDWIPLSEMTTEQRAQVARQCCGAFFAPKEYQDLVNQFEGTDVDKLPLRAGSDTSLLEDGGETSVMRGNVFVRQGARELTADEARIQDSGNNTQLSGNVTFREPGVLLIGERASVKMNEGAAQIDDAEFVLHESGLRGYAKSINVKGSQSLTLEDGGFTSCEPGSEDWFIKSDDIDIDAESGRGTVRGATIEILGLPVFYLPWAQFPIDDRRMSGFLVPQFSVSSDGPDLSVPYYFNIAPDYDATLTPRFIADRGVGLEAEGRWMTENQQIALSGAYWERDRDYGRNRWLAGVQQTGGRGKNWYSYIDYTKVSDIDYFRHLGTFGIDVSARSNLKQFAAVGYQTDRLHFGVEARQYQAISVTTQNRYRQLPHVWAEYRYPIFEGLTTIVRGDATTFDSYDDPTADKGSRVNAKAELLWRKEWLPGYLSASTQLLSNFYKTQTEITTAEQQTSTASIHHIEGGMYLERFLENDDNAWVFEPKVHFVYSDYVDQSDQPIYDSTLPLQTYESLFRLNRFSGRDRIGDTNRFTIAATTRAINSSSGDEWLRVSLAQAFYNGNRYTSLAPRLTRDIINNPSLLPDITDVEQLELDFLTQNTSDLMLKADVHFNSIWSLSSNINWSHETKRINQSTNYLQYSKYRDALVNVGLIYQRRGESINVVTGEFTDRDTFQSIASAYIPMPQQGWSLFGSWSHDLTYKKEIDILAGVEYESCCWRVALAYQRWIEPGTGFELNELDERSAIRFQVELKGTGGGQSSVDRLLNNINGYNNYESNY